MKKGTYLLLNKKMVQYLKFKAAATGENMSAIVDDLIQRDLTLNYEFYTKMEVFFEDTQNEAE